MMDPTFNVMKNGLLGNIFISLCFAYGFIFVFVLIFFVLRKRAYWKEQWGRKIQSCVKSMLLFGCKFFLSGFFGIFIIGPKLNAWFPSPDDNISGLVGTSIVVFIWLLYGWFRIVRIITVVAMGAMLIVILAQEYLPNSEGSFSNGSVRSNEVFPVITAKAQRTIDEEISQINKTVKVDPQYKICPLYDQTKAVKSGATIPVKLELCNASGADVSTSSIVVTVATLRQISKNSPGMLEDAGNANPDNNFRYDAALGRTGGYIFNLKTTGLSTGTYSLSFTAGSDPTVYSVQFQVE